MPGSFLVAETQGRDQAEVEEGHEGKDIREELAVHEAAPATEVVREPDENTTPEDTTGGKHKGKSAATTMVLAEEEDRYTGSGDSAGNTAGKEEEKGATSVPAGEEDLYTGSTPEAGERKEGGLLQRSAAEIVREQREGRGRGGLRDRGTAREDDPDMHVDDIPYAPLQSKQEKRGEVTVDQLANQYAKEVFWKEGRRISREEMYVEASKRLKEFEVKGERGGLPVGVPSGPKRRTIPGRESWNRGWREDTYRGETLGQVGHKHIKAGRQVRIEEVRDEPPTLDDVNTPDALRLQQAGMRLDTEETEVAAQSDGRVERGYRVFGCPVIGQEVSSSDRERRLEKLELCALRVEKAARIAKLEIVENEVVAGHTDERQMIVRSSEGVSGERIAGVLQGILRKAYGLVEGAAMRVCFTEKGEEWSEVVVVLKEASGVRAEDAAKRICKASMRELAPRQPEWIFTNNNIFKRGMEPATLRLTLKGGRPSKLRDAPYQYYDTTVTREYTVYQWDRKLKGYIDEDGYRVGRYTKD